MNRLVIIGNGFDLAHGLPTSYGHFIDDYWKNVIGASHDDDFISFENIESKFKFDKVENLEELANFIMQYDEKIKFSEAEVYREYGNDFQNGRYPRAHILNYKNNFFRLINQKAIQNWVDIENEYYSELKTIMKSESLNQREDEWKIKKKEKLTKLNIEFAQVKHLLEKYLKEKVLYKYDFNDYYDQRDEFSKMSDIFFPDHIVGEKNIDLFLEEFSKVDHEDLKRLYRQENHEIVKYRIQFLCFNYTPTVKMYFQYLKNNGIETEINLIHGEINNPTNLINFGFGDEMDEDYKTIENIGDNEYLRNFKSFQYLQTSNYKNLLDFIDSEKYQVYIMGHSCGLSDRTLLNTVFEHDFCRSIKVFSHKKKAGMDNYTEIVQNISRHFNNKKLMREKIVNKTLCQPLPQIQLPFK
jgi:hypothetical protein